MWLGYALACVVQGDLAAAETGIDHVLSREGKNLRALIMKGDLLAGRNDEQNAAAHYTLALRVGRYAALGTAGNRQGLEPDTGAPPAAQSTISAAFV